MDSQELQLIKNKYDIIGNDAALNSAIEMAVAVAPTDLIVLVTGESGVGKENIPKIIHQNSLRKNGKYFAVNCGAIPEGTVESELFGHEKGSFTGAVESRKGYFEEADGGTLFLDEVGELPLPYQAKLLRVLQSGEYSRVGSSKVSKTDVRVIAATNVDLRYAVAQGKFRPDLYYRLCGVTINMPALRDRRDDIYLLFRKFSSDFSSKYGLRRLVLGRDAIEALLRYRWPGNIRQLKNLAETVTALECGRISPGAERCEVSAATLSKYMPKDDPNSLPVKFKDKGAGISEDDRQEIYRALYNLNAEVAELKKIIASGNVSTRPQAAAIAPAREDAQWPGDIDNEEPDIQDFNEQDSEPLEDAAPAEVPDTTSKEESSLSIKDASVDLIRQALDRHHGNRKKAADELGISERTLYRKLPEEYRTAKKH